MKAIHNPYPHPDRRKTLLVIDMKHANLRGKQLYNTHGLENVIQKSMLDTDSWTKTVRAVRESYRIGLSLDIRNT